MVGEVGATHHESGNSRVELHRSNGFQSSLRNIILDQMGGKAYIDQIVRVGVTVSPNNVGLLTGKKATVILASGGDFSPGSPVEKYNQASGYLRQVLAWIGIKDVEFILAGRARAGAAGETAVEEFGAAVRSAAVAAPALAA